MLRESVSFEAAQARARAWTPENSVLSRWRDQRQGDRIANSAADSTLVKSGDASVLELFGASASSSGISVTASNARRVSAVEACIQRIAGVLTQVPLNFYRRLDKGQREQVYDSPHWFLFNERPCATSLASSWTEKIEIDKHLRGNSYAWIRRNPKSGTVKEIVPMPWAGTIVVRQQNSMGDSWYEYSFNDGLITKGALDIDVLDFANFGVDPVTGRAQSTISNAAKNAAGNALAMSEYSGAFFKNGSHQSIVLETEKKLNKEQRDFVRDQYVQKYSGLPNAHRYPLVLTEGMQAKDVTISAQDAQLLEARKFEVIDIARAFGVPPHLIGETSASTSWGSGLEEMTRAFVQLTILPSAVRREQEINSKLFGTVTNFAQYDRRLMYAVTLKSLAEYYRAAIGGPGSGPGWMTTDEVRAEENRTPMGGEAATLYRPPVKQQNTNTKSTTP